DLPGNAPSVLAPAACAFLPAITHDRIPVAVRLVLIIGRKLERKGFIMFERCPAGQPETGNAGNREFDRDDVTSLAGRVVAGCSLDGADDAFGKGFCVEMGGSLGFLVVPKANSVLCHRGSSSDPHLKLRPCTERRAVEMLK